MGGEQEEIVGDFDDVSFDDETLGTDVISDDPATDVISDDVSGKPAAEDVAADRDADAQAINDILSGATEDTGMGEDVQAAPAATQSPIQQVQNAVAKAFGVAPTQQAKQLQNVKRVPKNGNGKQQGVSIKKVLVGGLLIGLVGFAGWQAYKAVKKGKKKAKS